MLLRKTLLAATLVLCLGLSARAQVFIINDNMTAGRLSEIRTTVLDSLSGEPVSFASVYVIPSKDTTITNFTLTDAEGKAKLEEVPYGSYVFRVEMLGYVPFVKERYFRDRQVDMGTIRLKPDEHYLQAAVVSDVGNPIVVKQDTVEFNASAFRVGANAMLKDLLQRMPGMEITEDGKVKFNGEEIDKLTLGGRTFFFNDQSTALNNLPASIVDKVRVIDRESEATRASGIQDGSREKVLDVALKKEYEKGWFGNAGFKGGTTLGSADAAETLRDDRGLLYSSNALVSAYTEKDQLTFIANAQNVSDNNGVVFVLVGDDAEASMGQGLSNAVQLGVNANTSRIKDVETAASANYKYSDSDNGSRSLRTTYQEDGNLISRQDNFSTQYASSVNANLEFEKEKGNVWFHIRPDFRYGHTESFSTGSSETARLGTVINTSENNSRGESDAKTGILSGDITFRKLWGKDKRTLQFSAGGLFSANSGNSDVSSVLRVAGTDQVRNMHYLSDVGNRSLNLSVRYSEPVGEKLTLSASASYQYSGSDNVRDAFDEAGLNDYYSSKSSSDYVQQSYGLTAQYQFGEKTWLTLGGQAIGVLNETFSKSYGIEAVTGKDEWLWNLTPTFRFQHEKGNDRYYISASGYSQRPSDSRMLPVLNITDPSRLSLGNVYLKSSTQTFLNGSWTRNNREKFSTLMVYAYGWANTSPTTNATWYDKDGILYSIPVNSRKPTLQGNLTANYTTPLDSRKVWSMTLGGSAGITSSTSYQSRTTLPGLDKETFDYSDFMDSFWGDAKGDRFYSGESGFSESKTYFFTPGASLNVKYNRERYSFSIGTSTNGRIARYSLDPSINMNTLDTRFGARGTYTTRHEYEFNSDISYVFYKGYAAGYGQPEWQWNAEISKDIKAFNLSVKIHDILDQTRNLTHTVTANYEEDSYRLIMGRYILFGVKWNFGKMNASHSRNARNAAWNMAW